MAPARRQICAGAFALGAMAWAARSVAHAFVAPAIGANVVALRGATAAHNTADPATVERSTAGLLAAAAGTAAAAVAVWGSRSSAPRTQMRYTTEKILPSLTWLKTGLKSGDLAPGEFVGTCLGGVDVCIGKTQGGKLFCLGDKAPPLGIPFSQGAEVVGDKILEAQYGTAFDCFSGLPEGQWCPQPPLLGGVIGWFMGGPQAVAKFDIREAFLSSDIEIQVDTNAKKAYEADYWKGLLDAQGKDDGTYY